MTVDAFDAAGNHSAKSGASFATSACGGGGVTDTQAPSNPSGLHSSGATTTSISIAWTASTDNVGVAGYYLSRDGSRVATTTSVAYTFTGLSCGTSYSLAVSAFDLARQHLQPGLRDDGALDERLRHATASAAAAASSGRGQDAASVFLATAGSNSSACTAAAPCKSLIADTA